MNQEDTQLLDRAKADPREFAAIYNKYARKIFNYFWYRVNHNDDLANDLMQEVFIKAFNKLPSFEVRGHSYLTYLITIAHNIIVNYWRDQKQVEDISNIDEFPTEVRQVLEDKIDAENMWREVQKLPVFEREAILLRYRRELSVSEIAIIMGKSENAVQLLLSRARKRLRQYMNGVTHLRRLPDIDRPRKEFTVPNITTK